ncbi:MAG: YkgJ family cysteine cluster protein [Desulfofustis sp.]|jgi:Fe-S-cluster containining protein
MINPKEFPEGYKPLGSEPITFRCHPGVSCFTVCCRQVELDLYPYDIVRLKKSLSIDSETFMRTHTQLKKGANPYFPAVMLKMADAAGGPACPFLTEKGCSVYADRPTACRTYPLERAVDRQIERGRVKDYYFLTRHDYCKGHMEPEQTTVKQWVRSQRLDRYNQINDLWAELDTLFATNPWQGEGSGGPKQQLAFMVCYDLDGFRNFSTQQNLLALYRLNREQRKRIETDDTELLKFGFEWLKEILGGRSSLVKK